MRLYAVRQIVNTASLHWRTTKLGKKQATLTDMSYGYPAVRCSVFTKITIR